VVGYGQVIRGEVPLPKSLHFRRSVAGLDQEATVRRPDRLHKSGANRKLKDGELPFASELLKRDDRRLR
jgi:hypothetical protein